MSFYTFKQGFAYWAGVNKPPDIIVSREAAIEGITDMGFRVLYADECEKLGGGRLPFHTPTKCGDDWDWVGIAVRTGPTAMLEVPSRVKWIQEVPPPQQAQPLPQQQPAPQQPVPTQPPPTGWAEPVAWSPGIDLTWVPWAELDPPWTMEQDTAPVQKAGVDYTIPILVLGGLGAVMAYRYLSKR